MKALSEMGRFISGSIALARSARAWGELLGWEAAADVHAEAVTQARAVVDKAHKAETYDREAVRVGEEATRPESPGGVMITPEEWSEIRTRIARSAELDHDVSDAAAEATRA